jgi:hypothetical protein
MIELEETEVELNKKELRVVMEEIHAGNIKAQKIAQSLNTLKDIVIAGKAFEVTREAGKAASQGQRKARKLQRKLPARWVRSEQCQDTIDDPGTTRQAA